MAAKALSDLDLVIPAGLITAITGPSGAGKSTLADLLLGLLEPESGAILVDGTPLAPVLMPGWHSSVGYIPQEPYLFHCTIRENLLWAKPEAGEEEIWTVLRLAAAEAFVREMPLGLDTMLGDRGIRLSGGERQRIVLARALLSKPSLLLLDEATSALDQANEESILEALMRLRGRMTIVVIAHHLFAIKAADRIIRLENGRVAAVEEPAPPVRTG